MVWVWHAHINSSSKPCSVFLCICSWEIYSLFSLLITKQLERARVSSTMTFLLFYVLQRDGDNLLCRGLQNHLLQARGDPGFWKSQSSMVLSFSILRTPFSLWWVNWGANILVYTSGPTEDKCMSKRLTWVLLNSVVPAYCRLLSAVGRDSCRFLSRTRLWCGDLKMGHCQTLKCSTHHFKMI